MSDRETDRLTEQLTYHRRTVIGALAAGGSLAALGTAAAQEDDEEDEDEDEWLPADASEVYAAALNGTQAAVETGAGGCAHVTPMEEEDTLAVDVVVEDIECVTQAHIHEGERGEDGPVVAPLFEYTENPDGTGTGDPISTTADTPLIEGERIDDPELVEDILTNPEQYYVNVHTVHNPDGEVRGQILGFDHEQETELEPQPAEFQVSDLDPVEATVTQGDLIDVSATIRNAGDITETQTVEFRVNGVVVEQQSIELACRESETVTFENVDTTDLELGEHEHGIFTDDDSETGTLTVEDDPTPAEFLISDLEPVEATVTQGDLIDVSATVENAGEQEGTQTIELRIDEELDPDDFVTVDEDDEEDEEEDDDEEDEEIEEDEYLVVLEQELTLDADEEDEIVFEDVDTTDLEPDEYEHGVFSQDDSETGTLTVEEEIGEAEFMVSNLEPLEATVTQGDLIDVSADIGNLGEQEGTQTIELRIGEEIVEEVEVAFSDEQELTLDAGQFELVTFEDVDTAALDPGTYEHGIFSEDDSVTGTLVVEEEEVAGAEFTVSDLDPMDVTVTQGDIIDVSATITNDGDESGTQTVEFRVDGSALADQELTLDADESDEVTFADIDTSPLEPGDYEHGVFTDDDAQTATLTVEEEEEENGEANDENGDNGDDNDENGD